METRIRADEVVILEGPARIRVVEGSVSSLGALVEELEVPPTKSIPLRAVEDSLIEVLEGRIGPGDIDIPESWTRALDAVVSDDVERIAVVGGVDTGKSGLTTFLLNGLLERGYRTGVIDTDIGQSDIGPPTTLGLSIPKDPYPLLTMLVPEALYFVGLTSPRGLLHRVVQGLDTLLGQALERGVEKVILNPTGWSHGYGLYQLKNVKLSLYRPDLVIAFSHEEDVISFLSRRYRVVAVEPPPSLKPRDQAMRTEYRNWLYRRYLSGGETVEVDMDEVEVLGYPLRSLMERWGGDLRGILGAYTTGEGLVNALFTVSDASGERLRLYLTGDAWGIPTLGLLRLDPETFCEHGWVEELIGIVLDPES